MSKDWLIPDVIDPAETVCVTIEVPKDDTHIQAFFGALQELAYSYNWEWDGLKSGLAVARVWERQIDIAAQQVRTGVNCMVDCDDVEDCLETSTIINVIEGDIITNEGDITNNETNITNNTTNVTNITNGGNDTNVYPPLPTPSEPDELCGASYRIAQEIIDLVEQTVIDAGTITLAAWLLSWLGIGGWLGTQMSLFWDYIFANEVALSSVDFDDYLDQLAEAFYCAELDAVQAAIDLDPAITTLHRDAIVKGIESATVAQIALWAFVGSLDDTNDCSAWCPPEWCYLFDFLLADGGWVHVPARLFGIWTIAVGWESVWGNVGSNWDERLYIKRDFSAEYVTTIEFRWKADGTGAGNRSATFSCALLGVGVANITINDFPTDGSIQTTELIVNGEIDVIGMVTVGDSPAEGALDITNLSVEIIGTGVNPFGGDNC